MKKTLKLLSLALLLFLGVACSAMDQRKINRPYIELEEQEDGGICFDEQNAKALLIYIRELEQ